MEDEGFSIPWKDLYESSIARFRQTPAVENGHQGGPLHGCNLADIVAKCLQDLPDFVDDPLPFVSPLPGNISSPSPRP